MSATTTAPPDQELIGRLRRFVARRVRPDDVDDVVGEILLRVVEGRNRLRTPEAAEAWIVQVARSAVADHYRAPITRRERAHDEVAALIDGGADEAPDPASDDAAGALTGCLEPMVDDLPAEFADALRATDLGGETQRAAAERLGLSHSGMKSRVQRARDELRRQIVDCCRVELDARRRVLEAETPDGCCETPASRCA